MKALIQKPTGSAVLKELDGYEGIKAELDGGWLEAIPVCKGVSAYIDEEGKMKGLIRNYGATTIVETGLKSLGRTLLPGDYISGTIIYFGTDGSDTERDVPEPFIRKWFPNLL